MGQRENSQYHLEFGMVQGMVHGMYKKLMGVLLGTVIFGFGSVYYFHARVSVLESINGAGPRFTQYDFAQFKERYIEDRVELSSRVYVLEETSKKVGKDLREINTKLGFIVDAVKEVRKNPQNRKNDFFVDEPLNLLQPTEVKSYVRN